MPEIFVRYLIHPLKRTKAITILDPYKRCSPNERLYFINRFFSPLDWLVPVTTSAVNMLTFAIINSQEYK